MLKQVIMAGVAENAMEAEKDCAIGALITMFKYGGVVSHDWDHDRTIIHIPPALQHREGDTVFAIPLDFMGVYGVPFYQAIAKDVVTLPFERGMVLTQRKLSTAWSTDLVEHYREVFK